MKQVLQEYERTISELISDNKTEKGGIEVIYRGRLGTGNT